MTFLAGLAGPGTNPGELHEIFRFKTNSSSIDKASGSGTIHLNDPGGMLTAKMDKFYQLDDGRFYFRGVTGVANTPYPFPTGINVVKDMIPSVDESALAGALPFMTAASEDTTTPGTPRQYQTFTIFPKAGTGIKMSLDGVELTTPYEVELMSGVQVSDLTTLVKNFSSTAGSAPVAGVTRQIAITSTDPKVIITGKTSGDALTLDSPAPSSDNPLNFVDNNDGVIADAGEGQIINLGVSSTDISITPTQITRAPATDVTDLKSLVTNFVPHNGVQHVLGVNQVVGFSGTSALVFNPTSVTFSAPAANVADAVLSATKNFSSTTGITQHNGQYEVVRINPHPGITSSTTSITFRQKAANKATKLDYVSKFVPRNGRTQVIGVNQAVLIQPNSSNIIASPEIVSFPTQAPNVQPRELYRKVTLGLLKPGRPGVAGIKETGKDKYILQLDGHDVNIQGTTNKIELVRPLIGYGVEVQGRHPNRPANPSIITTNVVITQQAIRQVNNTAEDAAVDKVMDLKLTANAAVSQAGAAGLVDPNDGSLHRTGVTVVHLDPADETHAYLDRANLKAYIVNHYQAKARIEKHPNEM